MSLKSVSESFIPATDALAKAEVFLEDEPEQVSADSMPQNSIGFDPEDPATLERLTWWRERVETYAAEALKQIDETIFYRSRDNGVTHYDFIETHFIRGLDQAGFGYVTTTADMVTQAITSVLKKHGYRVREQSACIRDKHTPSSENPDYYRVELAIDWSEPLPPEDDGELAADTAN